MVDDKIVTFDDIEREGIDTEKIIIKTEAYKNSVFLELKDETKRLIGKDLDTVSLFGVRTTPAAGGPFFVAIIEEGTLIVYEKVLYKIKEEETDRTKNMRIYIMIW